MFLAPPTKTEKRAANADYLEQIYQQNLKEAIYNSMLDLLHQQSQDKQRVQDHAPPKFSASEEQPVLGRMQRPASPQPSCSGLQSSAAALNLPERARTRQFPRAASGASQGASQQTGAAMSHQAFLKDLILALNKDRPYRFTLDTNMILEFEPV